MHKPKPESAAQQKLYRKNTLVEKLDIGRTTLDEWVASGEFPQPIKIGPRAIAWLAEEVDQWLDDKMSHREGAA